MTKKEQAEIINQSNQNYEEWLRQGKVDVANAYDRKLLALGDLNRAMVLGSPSAIMDATRRLVSATRTLSTLTSAMWRWDDY